MGVSVRIVKLDYVGFGMVDPDDGVKCWHNNFLMNDDQG
jgi:hypothetical protein